MLKKMVAGELGLGITFWKYGVLFLSILTFVAKLFERLLYRQIGSYDLAYFFRYNFSLFGGDTLVLLWTLCYISAIIAFIYYVINYVGGIWRSSAKYERSNWLKNMARFFSIILVVLCCNFLY